MNATVTHIQQPAKAEATSSEVDAAWIEHEYRLDVARRYFDAVHAQDRDEAASIWIEAGAWDKAHQGSSPLLDELDISDLQAAA
jgi:hypothetical protein